MLGRLKYCSHFRLPWPDFPFRRSCEVRVKIGSNDDAFIHRDTSLFKRGTGGRSRTDYFQMLERIVDPSDRGCFTGESGRTFL